MAIQAGAAHEVLPLNQIAPTLLARLTNAPNAPTGAHHRI
jgi:two-component system chemotaxis response regulator CheB